MLIDKNVLKNLKPCADRYKNFLEFHAEFSGTFSDFIDLSNVSYEDKIWVSTRVLNRNQLVSFAVLCADSVLHIFEAKFPEDKRVANLLIFMKSIKDFSNITDAEKVELERLRTETRNAANAAARSAYCTAAAYAAARSAYYTAAADTAYYTAAAADTAAAYAAYYTAADADATDATATAAYAAARKQQQDLNLTFLKQVGNV